MIRHHDLVKRRWLGVALGLLMAGCTEGDPSPQPATPPRPSILFISIDTLSAANMSLYGYARDTTPEIDRLAQQSVVFEQCSANAPWTLPSYLSVMTGLYPESHRYDPPAETHDSSQYWDRWHIAARHRTLAETLRELGYRTAAFVDNPWLNSKVGLGQGFDRFDEEASAIPSLDPKGGVRHIVPRALAWIDEQPPELPFFLFLHFFDVHSPYRAPDPWRGQFRRDGLGPDGIEAVAGSLNHVFRSIPASSLLPNSAPQRVDTRELRAAYDEGVRATDAGVGSLFAGLRQRDLLESAVVVVTADHGESMDEHQLFFSHGMLYESILHVPLVIHLPNGAYAGLRVQSQVQLVDLHPTLVALAGDDRDPAAFHGRSLVPLWSGGELEPRPQFGSGGLLEQASLRLGRWKLIEGHPLRHSRRQTRLTHPSLQSDWIDSHAPELQELPLTRERLDQIWDRLSPAAHLSLREALEGPQLELFDLERDPGETEDLAEQHPERVQALRTRLRAEQARARSARAPSVDSETGALDPAGEARLRALGYFD